jgi:ATP-dependent helicase YprA (DUF1998 family)
MDTVESVHKDLRRALSGYLRSQYLGKNPFLLSALSDRLEEQGVLWQQPYVELPPNYQRDPGGLTRVELPSAVKAFMLDLADRGLGVFADPFVHQTQALEAAFAGQDLLVATGTGSGKTECFMWPLIARLCAEARESSHTWRMRGVRAVLLYPMNALVSDQIGRLRRIIGSRDFAEAFRRCAGPGARRPQFGMYTGRTPYAGRSPNQASDRELAQSLGRLLPPSASPEVHAALLEAGRIPAKKQLGDFLDALRTGRHVADPEDAELITRFEMQATCPDILVTNYSMLELMLLREQESSLWSSTRDWLTVNPDQKLLCVIDEAHMYHGASGGEVALLIRRLRHKLGLARDRSQFILTTASLPHSTEPARESIQRFARELTSGPATDFRLLFGAAQQPPVGSRTQLASRRFLGWPPCRTDDELLRALQTFWAGIAEFSNLPDAQSWLYDHIEQFDRFEQLVALCRGEAQSLTEMAEAVFPDLPPDQAKPAVLCALVVAAHAVKGRNSRLPFRAHLLFRGLPGLYACTNSSCSRRAGDEVIPLGQVFLDDSQSTCPDCDAVVYELVNDRRCGALFLRGYVTATQGRQFLWPAPGRAFDKRRMREIHLFVFPDTSTSGGQRESTPYRGSQKNPVRPCYLDTRSGFLHFDDDSLRGRPGTLRLCYCDYTEKGRPDILTFPTCPHCRHQLGRRRLTSFATRGNEPFYTLAAAQLAAQPGDQDKQDMAVFPNQGRKVLLFSDSRQRAARLALDMSQAADSQAFRQVFMLAVDAAQRDGQPASMDDLYGHMVVQAAVHGTRLFHGDDARRFWDECSVLRRRQENGRPLRPNGSFSKRLPGAAHEHLLRLFCGAFNTVYDTALAWIEPAHDPLVEAIDDLKDQGVGGAAEDVFRAVFNAWSMRSLSQFGALGHTVSDDLRSEALPTLYEHGLDQNWKFADTLVEAAGWSDEETRVWRDAFSQHFLNDSASGRFFIDLSHVQVRSGLDHDWLRCDVCTDLTPFAVGGRCPTCGSPSIGLVSAQEYAALDFWREPIRRVLEGADIRVLDIEEHTAQLSQQDQRQELWSRTQRYEMRFQDLLQEGEPPVDILSCTTTMEVGIDIGALVAVGLRNVPPMRENYQQRAGRTGRRGAGLSTVVTYCEGGAHDGRYFASPDAMLRGEPRRPWLDVNNERLLWRHTSIIVLQEYLQSRGKSLESVLTTEFVDDDLAPFLDFLTDCAPLRDGILLEVSDNLPASWSQELKAALEVLQTRRHAHPDLYEARPDFGQEGKSLRDACYEEGLIPTYSFPKDVVSTYISDSNGHLLYKVERGLDIALGEYAPGRSIVVDKTTYRLGGLYRPSRQWWNPARQYLDDSNYFKEVRSCPACGWFGLADDLSSPKCPLCSSGVVAELPMVRPWGFGPANGKPGNGSRADEVWSWTDQPEYSTLPDSDDLKAIPGYKHSKVASRSNERVIVRNQGPTQEGFTICRDCGATVPGSGKKFQDARGNKIGRPYLTGANNANKLCHHADKCDVTLGFDFRTDILVFSTWLDSSAMDVSTGSGAWLDRAARTAAEALCLEASRLLDVDFTELSSGYRRRGSASNTWLDVYLYDRLSSGAGYAAGLGGREDELLSAVADSLARCTCSDSCHACLRHYHNTRYHSVLDRHAAGQLLRWGQAGQLAPALVPEQQWVKIQPLTSVLAEYGINLRAEPAVIRAASRSRSKPVTVYPSMWARPHTPGAIYVSDFEAGYARPRAVDLIKKALS